MRTGWLRLIGILLILTLVGDILALPLELFQHGVVTLARTDLSTVLGPADFHTRFPHLMVDQVTLTSDTRPSYLQFLLYSLEHGLAYTVVFIPVIFYALRTVNAAVNGDPFTTRMVRRLRNLGFMVLLGGIVAQTAAAIAGWVLFDIALPHDPMLRDWADPDISGSMWWLLPALLLLAFAAIVKRGVDYRAELEGVI
jgi:hypothetical protein